jgi:hypothetical protein
MVQTTRGPITSDIELIARLGFDDEQAANILGSPVSWFRAGFTKSRGDRTTRHLLRRHEIVRLGLITRLLGRSLRNRRAMSDYVQLRHGPNWARTISEAFDIISTPPALEDFDEIWMLLPDVQHKIAETETDYLRLITGKVEYLDYIQKIEGRKAQYLRDLLQFPGKLTFYTGSPLEHEKLQQFIGGEAINERKKAKPKSLAFKWDSPVGCWNSCLIGNPHGEARIFYPGEKGLVRAPRETGAHLVRHLEERAKLDPLQLLLME